MKTLRSVAKKGTRPINSSPTQPQLKPPGNNDTPRDHNYKPFNVQSTLRLRGSMKAPMSGRHLADESSWEKLHVFSQQMSGAL